MTNVPLMDPWPPRMKPFGERQRFNRNRGRERCRQEQLDYHNNYYNVSPNYNIGIDIVIEVDTNIQEIMGKINSYIGGGVSVVEREPER